MKDDETEKKIRDFEQRHEGINVNDQTNLMYDQTENDLTFSEYNDFCFEEDSEFLRFKLEEEKKLNKEAEIEEEKYLESLILDALQA